MEIAEQPALTCSNCHSQNVQWLESSIEGGKPQSHYYCHVCKRLFSTIQTPEREKRTYGQDWPAYNESQTTEKLIFLELLDDLCSLVPELHCLLPASPTKLLE